VREGYDLKGSSEDSNEQRRLFPVQSRLVSDCKVANTQVGSGGTVYDVVFTG
jgi:hypothetical protein